MAGVSVQHLALGLTLPQGLSGDAGMLRSETAGVFVPRVLAILADRLETRFGPGAVVVLRSLRLACRVRPADLRDARQAERIAEDIASQIATELQRPLKGRAGTVLRADAQLYSGPAEYAAVRLIAAADRQGADDGQRQTVAALWSDPEVAAPGQRLQILAETLRLGDISAVLAGLPEAEIARLADEMSSLTGGLAAIPAALRRALSERRAARDLQRAQGQNRGAFAEPGTVAEQESGRDGTRDGTGPPGGPVRARQAGSGPQDREDQRPSGSVGLSSSAGRSGSDGDQRSRASARDGSASPLAARNQPDIPAVGPDRPARPTPPASGTVLTSDWCGLLYLVNVSLRLGLPERLWLIGIEEGAALAAMLGRLGAPDDPAAQVLAAGFPHRPDPVPTLADWAWHDLCDGLLPRPLWGATEERVPAFEAALRGDDTLSLASWGAGLHLAACEHVLERPLTRDTARDLLRRPGQILLEDGAVTVVQPLEAIDIDLRRVGLDADPGWLPWLGKTLRFRFAGGEDGE